MGQLIKIDFASQRPDIKTHVKDYWTKRSDGFFTLREDELKSSISSRWLNEIERLTDKKECLDILDAGCGTGFFEVLLGTRGHCVTGIDLTPSMISKANELIAQYSLDADRVKCICMDAESLSFADETFDLVISRNLTWTLPHPVEAYREWNRVLKIGGLLLNFDAEYAKGAHNLNSRKNLAHKDISDELKEECHSIYHMLSMSSLDRPEWDCSVLQSLSYDEIEADKDFGSRIYTAIDEFYTPDKMFCIRARKLS